MIDHMALDVRDPEKSRWFYEQALGTDGRAKFGLRAGSPSGPSGSRSPLFGFGPAWGTKVAWAKGKRCRRRGI